MLARIVWGRIATGRWDEYEAAYREAMDARGNVPGLAMQWLCRDEADPDAGYDVSLWQTREALAAYVASPGRAQVATLLKPYFVNQFTATHCDVRQTIRMYPKPGQGDLDIYHTN